MASSSNSPSAEILLHNPHASPPFARMRPPVTSSSNARPRPINRGNRSVPPQPVVIPSVTPGCANTASAAAIRARHANAKSRPPPMQYPRMAATTGFAIDAILPRTSCPRRENSSAEVGVNRATSAISAPAANARPVPVITAPAISGASASRTISLSSASITRISRRGNPSSLSSRNKRMSSWGLATRQGFTATLRFARRSGNAVADKINDGLRGRSGEKNFGDPALLQRGNVRLGNNSADQHGHIVHALAAQQFHQSRTKRIVRAGKNRKPDHVHIFLRRRRSDHFRSLPQPCINHFHTGIAQRSRNNFRAAVVPIEARLGNQHSNFLVRHMYTRILEIPSKTKAALSGRVLSSQIQQEIFHQRIELCRIIHKERIPVALEYFQL